MTYRRLVLDSFKKLRRGHLAITLPDGTPLHFGGLGAKPAATIHLHDEAFFRRCVLHGPIGFGESHTAGEWTTPDLTAVIAFFILNADDTSAMQTRRSRGTGPFNLLAAANRLLHLRRPNSRRTSRANISEHYDLSNDFFALWLDPSMTYSSAIFDHPEEPLEQAQSRKYERLCRQLHLAPTDRILEIGTGWGGFAIHAARHHGCHVTTTTISQQQFDEAARRIDAAGLGHRIELLLRDYRDLHGSFDKIVSIEMLEAVGDRYLDGYFASVDRLLAPHGLVGLQAILCPDRQYPILRDGVDFIQKHIFPGSLLMSNARISRALNAAGDLNLLDHHDLGPHYALTLRRWREVFEQKLDAVRALGLPETFIRKWRYYLAYCEAAFGTRHITVAQIILTRPDNLSIPSPIYPPPA
jgi:cyclopropane-fatty-acyl-phospholipid synthase